MVVHACSPSTWEVEAEDWEFKVIVNYILNKKAGWLHENLFQKYTIYKC